MSSHGPERASAPAPEAGGSLLRGLRVQLRCMEALMVRDLMMRYGRGNLGFLWVLIEPMILCVGVMIVWSMIKGNQEHGIDVVSFVLTGYMPLTLWRHVTQAGIFGVRRTTGLLFHRHITVLDAFLARMVLEIAGATGALAIVVGVTWTVGLIEPIQNWSLVVAGWLMMALISFGASLMICALTEYSEVMERFVQPYQYLLLPLCGAFFMTDWLPTSAQEIIWYNPTVHCYEAIRAGFFGTRVKAVFDPWYVIIWSLVLIATGMWLLDKARDKIHYS